MKTKEWLASHLENGDVLTAEVLLELLDSYIHKSEFGGVGAGDERVVSGDAVNRAIDAAASSIIQTVRGMVSDILAQILPGMLANYVTSDGLAAALADMATKTWADGRFLKLTGGTLTGSLSIGGERESEPARRHHKNRDWDTTPAVCTYRKPFDAYRAIRLCAEIGTLDPVGDEQLCVEDRVTRRNWLRPAICL